MARKRKRKQRERETGSLQGELLSSVEARPESSDVQLAHEPSDPGTERHAPDVPVEEDTRTSAPSDESPASSGRGGDRWAKAVGRREPSHRKADRVPAREPLARAKDLVQHGRIQEAIELYLGILTVNPGNVKAHNNLGVLLDGLKRYESALQHLEAAERLAPENVEVLTNFASTLTSLARYEEAESVLRRAQKLDADNLQVRLAIAILYFRRGLYAQAEADLRWVCSRTRDIGLAFYYRGEALNRLGRFDESKQSLERAAELLPNDPRPFYTLGHLYDRKHLAEEASEMYRRARRLQRP